MYEYYYQADTEAGAVVLLVMLIFSGLATIRWGGLIENSGSGDGDDRQRDQDMECHQ